MKNPISFEVDGEKFFLDFKYHKKQVETISGEKRESTHPYTTVFIMRDRRDTHESDEVFLSHTVGVLPKFNFSRPDGRIWALRAVGKTLSKNFRRQMWEAYAKRLPKRDRKGNVIQD